MKANQSHYQYIAHYGYILNEVNRYVETSIFTGGPKQGKVQNPLNFPNFTNGSQPKKKNIQNQETNPNLAFIFLHKNFYTTGVGGI